MTWEYDNTLPTAKDQVRFLLQDTTETAQLFQDEEVSWLLTHYGSVEAAAFHGLSTLASRFSALADKSVGDLSISYSQRAAAYAARAREVAEGSGGVISAVAVATPYAGGLSLAEKTTDTEDADLVQPSFTRKQMDYPGT